MNATRTPGKKRGKKYRTALSLLEMGKAYSLEEAVAFLKKMDARRFTQTVNLSINLNVDPKKAEQNVRGFFSFPHGIGRSKKVLVFAESTEAETARQAGADYVGSEDLIAEVQKGLDDFDVVIAPQYMMPKIGKLGKVLGPKGKMPSPKAGTVTSDIAQAVKEFKAGRVEFRVDATGTLHLPAGKINMESQSLAENIGRFLDYLKGLRPSGIKGEFIRSVYVSPTMGPSVKIKV